VTGTEADSEQTVPVIKKCIIQHLDGESQKADWALISEAREIGHQGPPAGTDVCRVTQTCSGEGDQRGRVLTNILAAKAFKRDLPATALLAAANMRQGAWLCKIPPSAIDEDQLSERDMLEIMRLPHTLKKTS